MISIESVLLEVPDPVAADAFRVGPGSSRSSDTPAARDQVDTGARRASDGGPARQEETR